MKKKFRDEKCSFLNALQDWYNNFLNFLVKSKIQILSQITRDTEKIIRT